MAAARRRGSPSCWIYQHYKQPPLHESCLPGYLSPSGQGGEQDAEASPPAADTTGAESLTGGIHEDQMRLALCLARPRPTTSARCTRSIKRPRRALDQRKGLRIRHRRLSEGANLSFTVNMPKFGVDTGKQTKTLRHLRIEGVDVDIYTARAVVAECRRALSQRIPKQPSYCFALRRGAGYLDGARLILIISALTSGFEEGAAARTSLTGFDSETGARIVIRLAHHAEAVPPSELLDEDEQAVKEAHVEAQRASAAWVSSASGSSAEAARYSSGGQAPRREE